MCGCILVNDTVTDCLIHFFYSCFVCDSCIFLVSGLYCESVLLNDGTKLALKHFVLKCLGADDLDSLLGTLDIRQSFHLLSKVPKRCDDN